MSAAESAEATEEFKTVTRRKADPIFRKFRERVDREPEQVLRYDRGGTPLWIGPKTPEVAKREVPPCAVCGGPRVFEFQVMPQLAAVLEQETTAREVRSAVATKAMEELDWGVLAVYTCSKSCDIAADYAEEFVWHNPVKDEELVQVKVPANVKGNSNLDGIEEKHPSEVPFGKQAKKAP